MQDEVCEAHEARCLTLCTAKQHGRLQRHLARSFNGVDAYVDSLAVPVDDEGNVPGRRGRIRGAVRVARQGSLIGTWRHLLRYYKGEYKRHRVDHV